MRNGNIVPSLNTTGPLSIPKKSNGALFMTNSAPSNKPNIFTDFNLQSSGKYQDKSL